MFDKNFIESIPKLLAKHDVTYFGPAALKKHRHLRHVADVAGRIADLVFQHHATTTPAELMALARATIAQAGQLLNRLSLPGDAAPPEPIAGDVIVGNADFAEALKALLLEFVHKIAVDERAKLGEGADAAEITRMLSIKTSEASHYLRRASTSLWAEMLEKAAEDSPDESNDPRPRDATADDHRIFLAALTKFTETIKALNIKPTSLSVGETAPAEAEALNVAFNFLLHRRCELRRWTRPEAFVDMNWSYHTEVAADTADHLLAITNRNACDLEGTVRGWCLRGHPELATEMADCLAEFQQLAAAEGLEFDDLLGQAESYVAADNEEDALAKS